MESKVTLTLEEIEALLKLLFDRDDLALFSVEIKLRTLFDEMACS